MRRHPRVFEANARLLLARLRAALHRPLTLVEVPQQEWERIAQLGFDAVWLMGLWRRSPRARRVALSTPALVEEYGRALPGWTEQDIDGSPYAVLSYTLDPALGDPEDLGRLRDRLRSAGLRLIVDFVPNHLALDHPWTVTHPQRFVRARPQEAHPEWFFRTPHGVLIAHGRDPYFGPWTDTAQVDFFSPDLRGALLQELLRIADVADGVRCDMAMLGLNDVFEWLWGQHTENPRPETEFWDLAVSAVKARHPDFIFLAEVYWGREQQLQDLGFDYTYDKVLYDRLRWDGAASVRDHILGQGSPGRWARFIENHDEQRAAHALGGERSRAAAAIIATLPGLRLFHDGQAEGRTVRVPVQMVRQPDEPTDEALAAYYRRLLRATADGVWHDGDWRPLEVHPSPEGEHGAGSILAWTWRANESIRIVAVNYSPAEATGWLATEGHGLWQDLLAERPSPLTAHDGRLALSLAAWQACIFAPA